jgi:hypothetical protein
MTDDRFEHLMRDAERTYRVPPEPDLEGMWNAIASQMAGVSSRQNIVALSARPERRGVWHSSRVRIAAALIAGVALGRASIMLGSHNATPAASPAPAVVASVSAPRNDASMARPYEVETSQYLGQTAALLVALPTEVKAGRADQQFTARAEDLLTRTRLLMDSPAANDPAMRSLFDDLELVLAQVVRLQNNGNRIEMDLINRALEQRDVIPRLRTAAADISAN